MFKLISTTEPLKGGPTASPGTLYRRNMAQPKATARTVNSDLSGNYCVCPEEICGTVHDLLKQLPVFEQPDAVSITDGLYFFCEGGESSSQAPKGRIVRVGTHPNSDGRLVQRLREHYRGSKNNGVFRRYLGGALMRQ